jgi:hypothetical protein
MDFIIDLPPFNSYDSILVVVVDHSMKMVNFIPCTKITTSKGTAKLFFDHIFWYHGLLKYIISDHKLQFASKFWKQLFELLGVKLSLVFHPHTDG